MTQKLLNLSPIEFKTILISHGWITKRCDELWDLNFRKTNKKGKTKPDLKRYTEWAKSNYDIYAPHGPSIFWFEISKF